VSLRSYNKSQVLKKARVEKEITRATRRSARPCISIASKKTLKATSVILTVVFNISLMRGKEQRERSL
jgi:hypothetical protein